MKNLYKTISINGPFWSVWANHLRFYPTPCSLNYSWSFGSLVGLFFAIQIVTGIFLAMHYIPTNEEAFNSIIHIMRDVNNGWLIRYAHANGASMIFILIYLHIGRGLYYESYKHRSIFLWWTGLIIFILMMATAFLGYVLPWGQMSFWGATVITSLVTAIPFVGDNITHWLWGGFAVSGATLTRFFAIHYILPIIVLSMIATHLIILHQDTSSTPIRAEHADKIAFLPYFFWKDLFAFNLLLILYAYLIFFEPNLLGHSDNWIRANPLVTPAHIVPEWYFQPFYAILRSCPSKLGGVVSMVAALLVLFILPFYRKRENEIASSLSPLFKIGFWFFVMCFLFLMHLGGKAAVAPYVGASQVITCCYFGFFLVFLPLRTKIEELFFSNVTNFLEKIEWFFAKWFYVFSIIVILFFFFLCGNVIINYIDQKEIWLIIRAIKRFCNAWPLQQWLFSILGLFLLYFILFYLYSYIAKLIYKQFGFRWKVFSLTTRFILCIIDIFLNAIFAIFIFWKFPDTVLASLYDLCPIALSPAFMFLELLIITFYSLLKERNWRKLFYFNCFGFLFIFAILSF